MAAAGGHWLKVAQGDIGKLVFVPKGRTAEQAITGRTPEKRPFPASLDDTQKIKGLGGSTGAVLVQDNAGNLYVKKYGKDAGHLLEESAADSAYRALGLNVPEHRIYETPNGPRKLTRFVDGETLGKAEANSPVNAEKALAEVRKGFAADALLANWDVIGMNKDNILIGKNGKVYRIDNGGSMRYRAQGGKKQSFDEFPTEIFTMRRPGHGGAGDNAAAVFGKLSFGDVIKQFGSLQARRSALLSALPKDLQGVMGGRLARFAQAGKIYRTLSVKGYSDKSIETFVEKLWAGVKAGKMKDPQTPAEIIAAFGGG